MEIHEQNMWCIPVEKDMSVDLFLPVCVKQECQS